MNLHVRPGEWLLAVALACALTGCHTPDLKPLADSTAAMHSAVKQSRAVFVRELQAAQAADPANSVYPALLAKFDQHWSNRLAVMTAMVDYSETLAAVADAPRAGTENVKAIGKSIEQVAAQFSPYGPAVSGGAEIAQKLYGLVANAMAARTLRRAVEAADGVVGNVTAVLVQDLNGMAGALRVERAALPRLLQEEYSDALDARKNLLARRKEFYTTLSNDSATDAAAAAASYNDHAAQIDRVLADMDQWHRPLTERIEEADRRIAAGIALLENGAAGFRQWGATHHTLAADLKERRQPNWRLLMETAREIEADIERMRKP